MTIQNLKLNRKSNNNQGFSLLEIVIATAIFGLVAVIALSSVNTFTKADNRTKYKRDAINTYQNIYQIISRELWSAKSIDSIENNNVKYTDASGTQKLLKMQNGKMTLSDKKMQADNIDIEANFAGSVSAIVPAIATEQPYVTINISKISVKNPKNTSIIEEEFTGDMGFTKILRIK